MKINNHKPIVFAASSLLLLSAFALSLGSSAAAPAKAKPTFANVKKLLDEKCVKCHNTSRPAQGLDLSSYDSLMKGSKHGPVVVVGKPDDSNLVLYVDGKKTPRMPMGGTPLTDKEIATISDWVKAGAHK